VPASTVNDASESGKEFRHTMDLIQHDKAVFVLIEK
jgi:hypothetical protein